MAGRLTADVDADASGHASGTERRVRLTRVLSLVGRYHRLQDQRAVSVDAGVLNGLEVECPALLRPEDLRPRRVGLDRTLDATEQTARQIQTLRHA